MKFLFRVEGSERSRFPCDITELHCGGNWLTMNGEIEFLLFLPTNKVELALIIMIFRTT